MNNNFLKPTASVLLLSFLIAFDVHGQTQTLSVDDVLAIFYRRNLDLIAAQYNINQSRAEAVIASAIPNPTLGVHLGEFSGNLNKHSNATGCNHNAGVSCGPSETISFSSVTYALLGYAIANPTYK